MLDVNPSLRKVKVFLCLKEQSKKATKAEYKRTTWSSACFLYEPCNTSYTREVSKMLKVWCFALNLKKGWYICLLAICLLCISSSQHVIQTCLLEDEMCGRLFSVSNHMITSCHLTSARVRKCGFCVAAAGWYVNSWNKMKVTGNGYCFVPLPFNLLSGSFIKGAGRVNGL